MNQSEKSDEKLAAAFLTHRGYSDVVYEPGGNVPPDFLVDGRIAVEVRRLNQNHEAEKRTHGLEEVAIPLWQKVKTLALSLGPPTRGVSWFLFFDFSRPVETWKTFHPKLEQALKGFINSAPHAKISLPLGNGFQLEIFQASSPHPTFYVMGGHCDDDSGGWLIGELEKNLRICIREKTSKIVRYRSKYPEWWLVLVDRIGYGLDSVDQRQFRDTVSISHDWDKIILIDPYNPRRAFEI